jgi:hypothetical protein
MPYIRAKGKQEIATSIDKQPQIAEDCRLTPGWLNVEET